MRIRLIPLALLALAAACSDSIVDVNDNPSVTGTYVWRLEPGQGTQAALLQTKDAQTGDVYTYLMSSDTLTLGTDGHYAQKLQYTVLVNGTVVGRPNLNDHGTYVVDLSGVALDGPMKIHFESDYIQNMKFDAAVGTNGALTVTQDVAGEGIASTYGLVRK